MQEKYIKITILRKDRDRKFKIKKFPILIGKGKAKNIIPVGGDGVEIKHGVFFKKGNKIYYEDTSRNGTRVNGKLLVRDKVPLIPGTNELQIGRYRILVQNVFSIDSNLRKRGLLKKNILLFLSIMALMFMLLGSWLFFFKDYSFITPEITVENFTLKPKILSPYKPVELSSVIFNKDLSKDNSEVTYSICFINNNANNQNIPYKDTIKLKQKLSEKKPLKFKLPDKMISKHSNENKITVELEIISDKYEFYPILKREYLVSRKEKTDIKENIKLKTKISGFIFQYNIEDKKNKIKKINVNYGDKSPPSDKLSDIYLYERVGEYNFTVEIELANKIIQFKRLVIVEKNE